MLCILLIRFPFSFSQPAYVVIDVTVTKEHRIDHSDPDTASIAEFLVLFYNGSTFHFNDSQPGISLNASLNGALHIR
jgi:hypothetical protein